MSKPAKLAYVDPGSLGIDEPFPEVFAQFLADRLQAAHPKLAVEVEIGHGRDDFDRDETQDIWDEYCSLPRKAYAALANRVLRGDRKKAYLRGIAG